MLEWTWLGEFARLLQPRHVGVVLIVLSALHAAEGRRSAVFAVLAQYLFVGFMLSSQLYTAVVLVRLALALGICAMMAISAGHVDRQLARAPFPAEPSAHPATWRTEWSRRQTARFLFNLPALGLAGLAAYGIWRAYPLDVVPTSMNLVGYWLVALGLVLSLASLDPLRRGLGLLVIVSGFEGLYLTVERSLLAVGLLSIVDMLLALAIVYTAENWLGSLRDEAIP
jgi:hypothetical protein